jgi:membrane protein DedA with SNARE-associated domain
MDVAALAKSTPPALQHVHFPSESPQYRRARNALLEQEMELRRQVERVAAQRRAKALDHLIATYGYGAIAIVIGLESMGIPLPGETILVLAAIYAATHVDLNIWFVATAAAAGAIMGDNIGYWLGLRFGYPLIRRYGHLVGLTDGRIKLGQYLFLRHGAKVVFLGRFVALLRILVAFLAGANRMQWQIFLVANATGGVIWAFVFALGGYALGTVVFEFEGALRPILLAVAALVFFGCGFLLRHFEEQLQVKAEQALPGPLE